MACAMLTAPATAAAAPSPYSIPTKSSTASASGSSTASIIGVNAGGTRPHSRGIRALRPEPNSPGTQRVLPGSLATVRGTEVRRLQAAVRRLAGSFVDSACPPAVLSPVGLAPALTLTVGDRTGPGYGFAADAGDHEAVEPHGGGEPAVGVDGWALAAAPDLAISDWGDARVLGE